MLILVSDQEYSDGPTTSPQRACSDAQLCLGRCTGKWVSSSEERTFQGSLTRIQRMKVSII